MNIRALKKEGRASLKKNFWSKVIVSLIVTFDIDAILSVLSGEIISPILKLHQVDPEAIIHFIVEHHTPHNIIDVAIDIFVLLFEILILYVLKVGGTRYFIKSRTDKAHFSETFFCFTKESRSFLNVSFVLVCKTLLIILWGLLFIVPGVIKFYDYVAVEYLLAHDPTLKLKDALRLSKAMMQGNKLKFATLQLSFIGWDILEFFSFGILKHLYITPYKLLTYDEFFAQIKEEAEEKGNEELKKLIIK